MPSSLAPLRMAPLYLAAALVSGAAVAQTPSVPANPSAERATPAQPGSSPSSMRVSNTRSDSYSFLPWTRRGYLGINIGRSDYGDFNCGSGAFGCDDSGTRGHLYTGGLFNDWLGMEVGYLNEGSVGRGGGSTRSEGANLSLVGRVPLGAFNAFAKVGTTYGRTRVSADALSGLQAGRVRGWGGSYGVGVGFDFTPGSGVVLEWASHSLRVPEGGRRDVESLSLGYVLRF